MNGQATKAELAADIIEPLTIALGELALGTLLELADGNDEEMHRRRLACAEPFPTCRIKQP